MQAINTCMGDEKEMKWAAAHSGAGGRGDGLDMDDDTEVNGRKLQLQPVVMLQFIDGQVQIQILWTQTKVPCPLFVSLTIIRYCVHTSWKGVSNNQFIISHIQAYI